MVLKNAKQIQLKQNWKSFDLVKISDLAPYIYRRGDLVIITGCLTAVTPMKNSANWFLTVAQVDPTFHPSQQRESHFLCPTAMSRYEAIHQCGTCAKMTSSGELMIFFRKSTNPMVLHISGFCYFVGREDPQPLEVERYYNRDWVVSHPRGKDEHEISVPQEERTALEPDDLNPPTFQKNGNIVSMRGELKDAIYGHTNRIAVLPQGFRPLRELRFLANLLCFDNAPGGSDEKVIEHTVALTISPNGTITVQGGKVVQMDQKGQLRVLAQKKRGKLSFDGIRFSVIEGVEVKCNLGSAQSTPSESMTKIGAYVRARKAACPAVAIKDPYHDDVVMLEGTITWNTSKSISCKHCIARLPEGHWPARRETFFTRGGLDLEERRRVDIDVHGRIFCPEGAANGSLELTGIIFVASPLKPREGPRDRDLDDLRLQYQSAETDLVMSSFSGHDLLERFVRRLSRQDWSLLQWDLKRNANRDMLMPLAPEVRLKGPTSNPQDLNPEELRFWRHYEQDLKEKYGIRDMQTLYHLSDDFFMALGKNVHMSPEAFRWALHRRQHVRAQLAAKRELGITFRKLKELATELVDQMFDHWDFKSQLEGALRHDYRPPEKIQHMFPKKMSWSDRKVMNKISKQDYQKFEEVRQFFFLYETTGSNMTHCSLMGAQDYFTTTGKWHFPDSAPVQDELCKNIAWLYERQIMHFMSERQTSRFPFIEDLDVQAPKSWKQTMSEEVLGPNGNAGALSTEEPPDDLLMWKPGKDPAGLGDPGYLMRKRAEAIHMIFPELEYLEVYVYSASGYNKGKEMLKSSFHLVWPQLIVDADRAPVIRQVTLALFKKETDTPGSRLEKLQQNLLTVHPSNEWELVFDSTTINARNGLRLPYNDKASMVIASEEDKQRVKDKLLSKTKAFKKRIEENRPSKAIGVIRFTFNRDEHGNSSLAEAKWVKSTRDMEIWEWIRIGSCRRDIHDPNVKLTQWSLGPDVLRLLPKREGERFECGIDDGEGGQWITHRPYACIRRCTHEVLEFKQRFSDSIETEQEDLRGEGKDALAMRLTGCFIQVSEEQAVWRTYAGTQSSVKTPDWYWGRRRFWRPTEVVYSKAAGKILIEGSQEVVEVIVEALKCQKGFTQPDDNAVVPIYDVHRMSR